MPGYHHLAVLQAISSNLLLRRIGRLRNEMHRFVTEPKYAVFVSETEVSAFTITVEESPSEQVIMQREELAFMHEAIDRLKQDGFFA